MQEVKEITLVDLLVVIIKHRRLIVGAPLSAAALVGIILFALPGFGVVSFGTYTIRATSVAANIPPALENELGIDPVALAILYAQDVPEVTDASSRNGLTKAAVGDPEGWLFKTYIARSFIGRQYKVSRTDGMVIFELVTRNPKAGTVFLSEMMAYTEKRLRSEIASRSALIAESMGSMVEAASGTNATLSDAARQLILASNTYKNARIPALVDTSPPEIFINAQGRGKKTALVAFAVLFCSVFLAFVLEYVERVKNDPEASAKIRKALGK